MSTGGAGYGDTDVVPTPEDHPTKPISPYGVSKVAAELYLACWESLHGLSGIVLRLANIYGPRQSPHGEAGVVAIFTERLLRGEPCIINGDGLQTRDYVYVGDVAEAARLAVERPDATGRRQHRHRRRDLGGDPLRAPPQPRRAATPRRGTGRRGRASSGGACSTHPAPGDVLGWSPRVTLDEGLRRTVASRRAAA